MVSVIMPVYNERRTIRDVIAETAKLDEVGQIIVVDDGSTDGTKEELRKVSSDKVEVITSQINRNRGYGWAVCEALSKVKYDIVVFQDADLEYDPRDYRRLLLPILSGRASVVYGNRLVLSHFLKHPMHFLGNKLITLLVNILNRGGVTDVATAYKMFKREVIKDMAFETNGFEFCIEFTTKVLKSGVKIHSVPIAYEPRSNREGKKIRWPDRFRHFKAAFYYAFFSPRT